MKFLILLVAVIHMSFCSIGQRTYESNLWTSAVLRGKWKQWNLTTDIGYRFTETFIQRRRTALGRILVDYGKNDKHRFGLGLAYFEHYNTLTIGEPRFFIHYLFNKAIHNHKISSRLRNEFRLFENGNLENRTRLQISDLISLTNKLSIQLSVEHFLTPGKDMLHEQRYLSGLQFNLLKNVSLQGFYQLQYQSTINYAQHIIGTQFIIQIN